MVKPKSKEAASKPASKKNANAPKGKNPPVDESSGTDESDFDETVESIVQSDAGATEAVRKNIKSAPKPKKPNLKKKQPTQKQAKKPTEIEPSASKPGAKSVRKLLPKATEIQIEQPKPAGKIKADAHETAPLGKGSKATNNIEPENAAPAKSTKPSKAANTTAAEKTTAAAEKKTTKSAVNKTASLLKKANTTMKANRRLSAVSSLIKKSKNPSAIAKMSIGDKAIMAIATLNEKGGSSMRNIINYMCSTYSVEKSKISRYVRAALKKFYEQGTLVQKKNTEFNINRKFQLKSNKKYQNIMAEDEQMDSIDDDEDVK